MRLRTRTIVTGIAATGMAALIALPTTADATLFPAEHTIGGATYQGGWAGIWAVGPGNYASAQGAIDAVGHFHATVTCLNVTGNDGTVTARINTSTDTTYPAGEWIVAEAVDNGGPGDLWRLSFQNSGGIYPIAANCYRPYYKPVPIDTGHVNVH